MPNEKITWEKLAIDTPRFVIESDATIVAPLIFAYVLADESAGGVAARRGDGRSSTGRR